MRHQNIRNDAQLKMLVILYKFTLNDNKQQKLHVKRKCKYGNWKRQVNNIRCGIPRETGHKYPPPQ